MDPTTCITKVKINKIGLAILLVTYYRMITKIEALGSGGKNVRKGT